jgi:hypothetical protein
MQEMPVVIEFAPLLQGGANKWSNQALLHCSTCSGYYTRQVEWSTSKWSSGGGINRALDETLALGPWR